MAKRFESLTSTQMTFINEQKMFFVGTAASTGKVNISPKAMDSFRVIDESTVAWLNLTGSGNETSAHIQQLPRMTIMFCAFSGAPEILRLYGSAQVLHKGNDDWSKYITLFPEHILARQIFVVDIEMVLSSCGFSVPFYTYDGERETLNNWGSKKTAEQVREYWQEKNQLSLDGFDTNIMELNKSFDN